MKAEEVFLKIGNEFLKEDLTIEEFEKDPDLIIIPKAMREYARIQIEKDRKAIINSVIGDESGSDIIKIIENATITLD